jgi:uncharacterized membrane protein YkoI
MRYGTILAACTILLGADVMYAETQTAAPKKPAQKAEAKEAREGAEQSLKISALPPAVKATVEAETKNATLKGLSKETEGGKTVYEVETLVNGRTRDLMIDAAGKVYDIEEQLDIDKAPAPVRAAIEAKGKVLVLEAATTNGKTHYEGRVQTKAGKKVTFDLDPDGKPVKK